jgi:hypothetical protein
MTQRAENFNDAILVIVILNFLEVRMRVRMKTRTRMISKNSKLET